MAKKKDRKFKRETMKIIHRLTDEITDLRCKNLRLNSENNSLDEQNKSLNDLLTRYRSFVQAPEIEITEYFGHVLPFSDDTLPPIDRNNAHRLRACLVLPEKHIPTVQSEYFVEHGISPDVSYIFEYIRRQLADKFFEKVEIKKLPNCLKQEHLMYLKF